MDTYKHFFRSFYNLIINNQLWLSLGWIDILQKYRRSYIGPLWTTLSMAILVLTLGVLYGMLFKQELNNYIPYLTAGIILWNFLSNVITEGASVFIEHTGYIKQINLNELTYIFKIFWRNIILLIHNLVILVIVLIIFHDSISINILYVIPGTFVFLINIFWIVLILSILSARFRDMPPLISSILLPIFYFTPVIWNKDQLNERAILSDINPFYHLIDLIRSPLLNHAPEPLTWKFTIVMACIGLLISIPIFQNNRKNLPYWL